MPVTALVGTFAAALLLATPSLQLPAGQSAAAVDPPVDVYAEASAFGVVVGWAPSASQTPSTTDEFVVSRSTDGGASWTDVGPAMDRQGTDTGYPVAEGVPSSGSAQFRVREVRDGVEGPPSAAVVASRPASSLLVSGVAGYDASGPLLRRGSLSLQGRHAAYVFPTTAQVGWAVSPDGQEVVAHEGGGTSSQPYRLVRLGARGSSLLPGTPIRSSSRPFLELEWSPDGQKLVWREYDVSTSTTSLLWGPVAGTTRTTSPEPDFRQPHWLPDSSTLVGVRFGHVAFLDTTTGTVHETPVVASSAAVSPDGRSLLVTNDGPGVSSTFSLHPLDPNTLRLGSAVSSTVATGWAQETSFGPDGRSVLFRGPGGVLTAPVTPDGHVGEPASVAAADQRVQHAAWHSYRPDPQPVRSATGAVTSFTIAAGLLPGGTAYACALDGDPATPCASSWVVPPGLEGGRHTLVVRATLPSGEVTVASRTWTSRTGLFTPVRPQRVLDTRTGLGAPQGGLGPQGTVTLTIPGLPADTTAVALNLTATAPTSNTYLTAYPGDRARPVVSTVNVSAGQTLANLAVVGVGPGGKVRISNANGTVHAIADLTGYYRAGTGSRFVPVTPGRLLDTRTGQGASRGPMGSGDEVTITAPPALPGATALALTVTATGSAGSGYFTVYRSSTAKPAASTLNYARSHTIANLALVGLDTAGTANLANTGSTAHAIADATGYFAASGGAAYTSVTPRRVVDTRSGVGVARARVGAGRTITVALPDLPRGTSAAMLNVTAVQPAGPGYLTAYPAGVTRPGTSTVNFVAAQTISASTAVAVDADGRVTIANGSSSPVDVVVDLSGYYAF